MERIEIDGRMKADFRQYLLERENSTATIEKYMRDVDTFFLFLGEEKCFTKETLLEYKKWLMQHYASSSINSMLVALNQFLTSQELGRMKVKRLKIQQQHFYEKEKELTRNEYQRLVRTARQEGKEQLAMIMETVCATGIRISELSSFCVGDVKKGIVQVFNKGKYRQVILPKILQKKLLAYAKEHHIKNGPIFITRNGKAKDRSNIWREMKQISRQARVDENKVFPHNLRHLFARTFYKVTKNLAVLADILGHSSMEITRIYTSESIIQWRKDIERLNLLE